MLPEIRNADGTERFIRAIPEPNESAYDLYISLRSEFNGFMDPKYQNLTLKDVKKNSALKAEWQCSKCGHKWITIVSARATQG